MSQTPKLLYPFDEGIAAKIADVAGPSSAAAHALTEITKRRDAGEDVYLFIESSTFVVGPWPNDMPHIELPVSN